MEFQQMFTLAGETAVITGGGTGLGLGIAKAFVSAGARVVITGRRQEVLEAAVQEIGPAAEYALYDVTEFGRADEFAQILRDRYGTIGILINNAGNHLKKRALDTTEDEFNTVMETHVTGAFALTRRLAPAMVERGFGSVVFMASMTSLLGMPLVPAYSAAKSAVMGLVRQLAVELGPQGVRVNAIAPGWIQTPMLDRALSGDPERRNRILKRTPMARFGDPEDIAMAAIYLCSPAARFVNGVLLPVDGGASIGF
jgi:gluconate 5-dehydrogenase